ncbi:unnamed protein product, partial [marine sediment metagenome]
MSKEYIRTINILGEIPIAGQVVMYDDFEHLLNWTQMAGEGDSIFELDPTLAKQGNQSLFMQTRTTAAAKDDLIAAERHLYILPSKVMSLLMAFRMASITTIKYINFTINFFDGTLSHTPIIRFLPNTPVWQYLEDDGSTYTEIPDMATTLRLGAWH